MNGELLVRLIPICALGLAACKGPAGATTTTISSASVASVTSAPREEPTPPGMVAVLPGTFTMGEASEKNAQPAHSVTLSKRYFIDKTEVTVADYAHCVAAGKCTPSGIHGPEVSPREVGKFVTHCNATQADRDDHPINCVDLGQAAAYCAFVDKRLPTEAEWEYAARGSDGRTYPWGNEAPGCERAVVSGCARLLDGKSSTQSVGSFAFAKAASGALDMAGNVWEWVYDGWDPQGYGAAPSTDPAAESAGELGVLRGGSWDFAATQLKSFVRLKYKRANAHVSTGIRCAQGGVERAAPLAQQGKPYDCTGKCATFCKTSSDPACGSNCVAFCTRGTPKGMCLATADCPRGSHCEAGSSCVSD